MSMGVPTIATNFSGNTEFMNDANSFLVNYSLANYSESDEWFGGLQHAVADVHQLAATMRYVVREPAERLKRGARAMRDMMTLYSPHAVGEVILRRLAHIDATIKARKQTRHDEASRAQRLSVSAGFSATPELSVCAVELPVRPPHDATRRPLIVIVSTFPPRACGVAEFSNNLLSGLRTAWPQAEFEVVALIGERRRQNYPPIVKRQIRKHVYADYAAAALLFALIFTPAPHTYSSHLIFTPSMHTYSSHPSSSHPSSSQVHRLRRRGNVHQQPRHGRAAPARVWARGRHGQLGLVRRVLPQPAGCAGGDGAAHGGRAPMRQRGKACARSERARMRTGAADAVCTAASAAV
jgi:hypothetical protein